MKKETRDGLIAGVLAIIIISLLVGIFYGVVGKPMIKDNQLCANNFNVTYSSWTGFDYGNLEMSGLRYEFIDFEHFNCCWKETKLSDEGYYLKEICKGFEREVER